jgi:DMSO/TMAO reductase YedYZ molybdopterin-dependent catalytic subunit
VWTGVRLLDVLGRAGVEDEAREVTVESLTGHRHNLPPLGALEGDQAGAGGV